MGLSVAIDGFRLVAAPKTSHSIYITDVVKSLSDVEEVDRVLLLIPRRPVSDSNYNDLIAANKVESICPPLDCFPERSFRSQIYWVQQVVPRLLQKLPDAVNCYIAPYHHPPILLPRGIRVVTVVHDVCGLKASVGYVKTKKAYYQHLFMFCCTAIRSDVIVPISEHTKREFTRSFPFLRSRVSDVVYNSVKSLTTDGPKVNKVLTKYGVSRETYFLAFGLPGLRKGLDLVVQAYRAYKAGGGQCSLVLIVPGEYRDVVGGELISNKIADVVVVSDIEFEERDALYGGAVALMFPSRCEGFGYPIVEAMRQGCPPIAWHNSPAAEIVGEQFPLLQTLSVKEIVESMIKYERVSCHKRLELREQLISRSFVFNGDRFGRQLLGVLHKTQP